MKNSEGVARLPRARRDEALAKPYTKEDMTNISEEDKCKKLNKFNTTPLNMKYFKM